MKRGYKVALVDEHYTSKRYSSCKSSVSVCTHDKAWRETKCNVCPAEKQDQTTCSLTSTSRVLEPQKNPARSKTQKIQNYYYKPSTALEDTDIPRAPDADV